MPTDWIGAALEELRNDRWRIDANGRIWRLAARTARGIRVVPVYPHTIDDRTHAGYRVVRVNVQVDNASKTREIFAHSVVWTWATGNRPRTGFEIDHRDRDRTNNAPGNLRELTRVENARNTEIEWTAERMAAKLREANAKGESVPVVVGIAEGCTGGVRLELEQSQLVFAGMEGA